MIEEFAKFLQTYQQIAEAKQVADNFSDNLSVK